MVTPLGARVAQAGEEFVGMSHGWQLDHTTPRKLNGLEQLQGTGGKFLFANNASAVWVFRFRIIWMKAVICRCCRS